MKTMSDPRQDRQRLAFNALASVGLSPHESVMIHQPDGNFQHERLVAFNASEFAGTNPHEFLSNYAVRYQDPNQSSLQGIANFIAPEVPAQKSQLVEYALYNFSDGYLAMDNLNDDIRGIGADFPTLRNPPHQLVSQRIPTLDQATALYAPLAGQTWTPGISSVGDGAAGSLEAVPTAGLALPVLREFLRAASGALESWVLLAGSDATAADADGNPSVQRPKDFDPAANARAWYRKR